MRVSISNKNSKLGKVPNISLPPCKACRPDAPCKSGCYAIKAYRMYPNVKKAWSQNFKAVRTNRPAYFGQIAEYLHKRQPRMFRWHVSGDILDQDYLEYMKAIALQLPNTKFLAFTKMYDLDYSNIPGNLSIVFSAWPGFDMPETDLPIAYMQDGTETRVTNAIECHGNCENCGMCWELKKIGKNVVFNKH